ncbi:hypothetical protein KP806_13785 [Paenibacillus sp. N4]|uniref:hypothetical protein n=1 Tax=Paenibacillus vietnamensis TaxID=2590547 RepID=UPI001CD0F4CC|nr:hypothetical protein [Paenibacillus vietnamensis]MCA0756122.1 hypothetical protein [Paenibacillus vietnamensis]
MRERHHKSKRRFRTGQWVEYDGLYSDDWGGDLVLVKGDLFPVHPQMGSTGWTYAGQSVASYRKPSRQDDYLFGY